MATDLQRKRPFIVGNVLSVPRIAVGTGIEVDYWLLVIHIPTSDGHQWYYMHFPAISIIKILVNGV